MLDNRRTYYWIATGLALVSLTAALTCIFLMHHKDPLTPLEQQERDNEVTAKHIGPTCASETSLTLLPLARKSPLPCTASNAAGVYTVRQSQMYPGCVDITVTSSDSKPLGVYHGKKYVDSNCPLVDEHPTISNDR